MNWENIDLELFASLVREKVEERGQPVGQIAEEVGISYRILREVLSGRRRLLPIRYQQISRSLGINEDELVKKDEAKSLSKTKGEKIFISYSHKDHIYLERLMIHLKPLEKQGLIDPWVDTRLLAGDKWKKEIEKALKSAKVGILLVSADFLASDFIIDNELPPMLQSAEEAGTLIIPVILKPCRFIRDKNLREFQAINSPDEPLCLLEENDRELIYDTIAQRIEDSFGNKG